MKITLVEDAEILDDVIVIGYATGSQRTVSGAIQRVGREDMNVGVVTNPLQAIKGKVAGVNIQKQVVTQQLLLQSVCVVLLLCLGVMTRWLLLTVCLAT